MLDLDQEFIDTYLDILMRFYALFEAIVRASLDWASPLLTAPTQAPRVGVVGWWARLGGSNSRLAVVSPTPGPRSLVPACR